MTTDPSHDLSQRPQTSTRDYGVLRKALQEWLAERVQGVSISELTVPGSTGMSSETVLFDLVHAGGRRQPCVARLAPAAAATPIFPEYDLMLQARAMQLVASRTDVPVPKVLWSEPGSDAVGSPFFVMERVEGVVPSDLPPYTFGDNWLYSATGEQQRQLEEASVGVLANVHSVPGEALLAQQGGPTNLAAHVADQRRYYDWATEGWVRSPLIERSFDWLESHMPVPSRPDVVCWGDSRISNVIYRDFKPVAVLDWEMVTSCPREMDLAWLVVMHRFFQDLAVTFGLPGMPDFLTRTRVEETYHRQTGHRPEDFDWYAVYASLRFAVIYLRIARRGIAFGEMEQPQDPDEMIMHRAQLESLLAGTYW